MTERIAFIVFASTASILLNPIVIIVAGLTLAVVILVTALFLFRNSGKKKGTKAGASPDWQRQGQQAKAGFRAHGRDIAQVDGHRFTADLEGRGLAAHEVAAFHLRVTGCKQIFVARLSQDGGVVADAHDHARGRRRQALDQPVDKFELTKL